MTTHYIDITLLPDPEFSHAHLLAALVAKLHRVLVQGQTTDIGVSYRSTSTSPRPGVPWAPCCACTARPRRCSA